MKRPGYMEILRPDEQRFAGEGAVMHYTREWPVLRGERTPDRVFYYRRRAPGLTRTEFRQRWLEGMRAIFTEDARPAGIAGYVQNHTVSEAEHEDGDDPKYFDVIDEFFLEAPGGLAALGRETAIIEVAHSGLHRGDGRQHPLTSSPAPWGVGRRSACATVGL